MCGYVRFEGSFHAFSVPGCDSYCADVCASVDCDESYSWCDDVVLCAAYSGDAGVGSRVLRVVSVGKVYGAEFGAD